MPTRLLGTAFSKDQFGIATFVVPYHFESEEEAAFSSVESPIAGLAENSQKRTGREWEGGNGYVVNVVFEGIVGSFDEDRVFWEFDSSFKHSDLRGHPELLTLLAKGGGVVQDDGTITWPLMQSNSGSGFGSSSSSGVKNPFFGADTYLDFGAVYRQTKIRRSVSNDLLDRVGTIKKSLPNGLPTPAGKDWLVFPPRAYERGNVIQEVDEWLLSAKGGWGDIQELLVI